MKRVLLYGDSNTWGYAPGSGVRFAEGVRWSGVLAQALGDEVRVVEEGLNGRTTVFDDPFEHGKNGKTYLQPCLASHRPLDLVVLMLGSNDLKHRFGLSAFDIGEGMRSLAELVLASKAGLYETEPQLLLVAPPHLNPEGLGEAFEGGVEKSRDLARYYLQVAEELSCHFFDAATVVASSPLDGVHLGEQAHRDLGVALAEQVRRLFALCQPPTTDSTSTLPTYPPANRLRVTLRRLPTPTPLRRLERGSLKLNPEKPSA
ncbi:SGNH/GDSL hydrolase family protein [soil metagenome]